MDVNGVFEESEITNKRLNSDLDTQLELFDEVIFDEDILPCNAEVLGFLYYTKNNHEYHKKLTECAGQVVRRVVYCWERLGIPLECVKSVRTKIQKLLKKYQQTKKYLRLNREQVEIAYLKDLFYVAKCKCVLYNITCNCTPVNKVPSNVLPFLLDQLTERCYTAVVNSDDSETQNVSVENNDVGRATIDFSSSSDTENGKNFDMTRKRVALRNSDSDPEYVPPEHINFVKSIDLPRSIKEIDLQPVVLEACRYGISSRAASALISRTLEAFNITIRR